MKTLGAIGSFGKEAGEAILKGDLSVKLSMIVMGAGYFRRKQFIKGILMTMFEVLVFLYLFIAGLPYLSKFGTLGTVQREMVFNPATLKNEVNDYDHSFQILLFSIFCILVIAGFAVVWLNNLRSVRKLQLVAEAGGHVNTFREDVREMLHGKFHITLLSLPVIGVLLFTIIPLVVLIAVAFTNYDQQHMPPSALFGWVGFKNFQTLFTRSITESFSYSFGKVLVWTLTWAVFATFTTYFGGVFLAAFINDKRTKGKRMWRTFFIIAIAVPQFVTLLLVRNFFADNGIVNTFCREWGITESLKSMGLVKASLSYIPFLSDPGWAKFMIIMINIWVGVPYLMLIATGVLMNIPADLMESAKIDGANSFQIFRKITMPFMLFVTGPYLVTSFVQNINNFNVIYLLTQDIFTTHDQLLANSHAKEVDLLVTWLYRLTQEYYNYKMASVIGIIVFIICAVFTLLAFNFMIKGDKEERFQ